MGISIVRFWEYLKDDANDDSNLKTGLAFVIRFIIIGIVKFFEYLGYLDFEGAQSIVNVVFALTIFLGTKDVLIRVIPQFKLLNPIYNLFVETFLLISILPLAVIFNLSEYSRDLMKVDPNFLVALSLTLIVGALLNLGIAFYKATNNKPIKYGSYVFWHNLVILFQAFLLLFMGLVYINPIQFSDFYSELYLYYLGR